MSAISGNSILVLGLYHEWWEQFRLHRLPRVVPDGLAIWDASVEPYAIEHRISWRAKDELDDQVAFLASVARDAATSQAEAAMREAAERWPGRAFAVALTVASGMDDALGVRHLTFTVRVVPIAV